MILNHIYVGDCLETLRSLPSGVINTCVTSPPYFNLRDYGVDGQIGLEKTPEQFITKLVEVFREIRRVLRDDGTFWLNIADSFNAAGRKGHGSRIGHKQGTNRASAANQDQMRPSCPNLKPKDLIGIPWMLAFALRADGWTLRQDVIWQKSNTMPESVTDRCVKSHEYIFLLAKSARYYFDYKAIREPVSVGYNGSKFNKGKTAIHQLRRSSDKLRVGESFVISCSGNKVRKPSGLRGLPGNSKTDPNGGVAGSIPWEGSMRNKRDVWTVATKPCKEAHFATFPEALISPCVLAGAPPGGIVLDPFMGAGTTALVASRLGRSWIGCELNSEYVKIAERRLAADAAKTLEGLL